MKRNKEKETGNRGKEGVGRSGPRELRGQAISISAQQRGYELAGIVALEDVEPPGI